jgi:hypothetical protein
VDEDYMDTLRDLEAKYEKYESKQEVKIYMAVSAAILDSRRLRIARKALEQIVDLPCADGTVGLRCWMPNCARCIALEALNWVYRKSWYD